MVKTFCDGCGGEMYSDNYAQKKLCFLLPGSAPAHVRLVALVQVRLDRGKDHHICRDCALRAVREGAESESRCWLEP